MKTKYIGFLLVVVALITGCFEEELVNMEQMEQSVLVKVQAYSGSGDTPASRLAYTDSEEEDKGVTVTWSAADAFFLRGETDGTKTYTFGEMKIVEKETYGKTEEFKGTLNRQLEPGETVTGYYPSGAYDATNHCFNVDVRKNTQKQSEPMAHLSQTNYMIGTGTTNDDRIVTINFDGGNKVAIVRFDMTLPIMDAEVDITEFQVESQNLNTVGTLDASTSQFAANDLLEKHRQHVFLDGYSTRIDASTQLSVYATMLPTELNQDMTVKLFLANGDVYSNTVNFATAATVVACNRYYIVKDMTSLIELDYVWYTSSQAGGYDIDTEGELFAFARIVNGTAPGITQDDFEGKTVTLKQNIALQANWTPIGASHVNGVNHSCFKGTFDGGGFTISQLNLDVEAPALTQGSYAHGFFGNTDGATIRNLTLGGQGLMYRTSGTSAGGYYLGGFVGEAKNTHFENCRNEIDLTGYSFYELRLGGFVGRLNGGSIKVCSNAGSLSTTLVSGVYAGGMIGLAVGGTSLSMIACYTEDVTIEASGAKDIALLGGLIGYHNGNNILVASYSLVDEIISDAPSNTNSYWGGLMGQNGVYQGAYIGNVYGCYALIKEFGYSRLSGASQYLNVGTDMNSATHMAALNNGIAAWNGTLSGVLDPNYCRYVYKQMDASAENSHLVLEELSNINIGQLGDMGNGGEIGREGPNEE